MALVRDEIDAATPLPSRVGRGSVGDAFASLRPGDAFALGAVGPRSVRLWVRTERDEPLRVELATADGRPLGASHLDPADAAEADHTRAFTIPDDVPALDVLEPDATYCVRVSREGGVLVGAARFRTAPPRGACRSRLSFAIASCHQPFDRRGRVRSASSRMLAAAERVIHERDARFLLLVGDQIYADYPKSRSLFESRFWSTVAPARREAVIACTRAEIRRLYQQRHRIFFGVDGFSRLQSTCPTYPMLDDHEIRDNFGSCPGDVGPEWAALRAGALDAFYDYQASRVLKKEYGERPPSFHYSFEHGPIAVFVADLRSGRALTGDTMRVLGDRQLADLESFLEEHADKPVAAVVVTVPLIHIESWMADALTAVAGETNDAADRWSHPKACAERDALLRVLHAHQRRHGGQKVLLVAGDIHVGSAMRLAWSDGTAPLYQLTSSALTHVQHPVTRWVAEQLPRTVRRVACHDGIAADVSLVGGLAPEDHNPFGGLNMGVVEIDCTRDRPRVGFKLFGVHRDADAPVCAYTSEDL